MHLFYECSSQKSLQAQEHRKNIKNQNKTHKAVEWAWKHKHLLETPENRKGYLFHAKHLVYKFSLGHRK